MKKYECSCGDIWTAQEVDGETRVYCTGCGVGVVAENDELAEDIWNKAMTYGELKAENARLKAEIERKDEALRFYSESEWDNGCGCCQSIYDPELNPVDDMGKKAKAALVPLQPISEGAE
jgi:hypothetical protein